MTPSSAPPRLRRRHLFDERYVLIGRHGHSKLLRSITVARFAQLEHVIVSLRGGNFVTPVDHALGTLGHKRNVVLSAASFLFLPENRGVGGLVALVPQRLVRDRTSQLQIVEGLFPVEGFEVMWHERNHGYND